MVAVDDGYKAGSQYI